MPFTIRPPHPDEAVALAELNLRRSSSRRCSDEPARLWGLDGNARAIAFYERNGLRDGGRQQRTG